MYYLPLCALGVVRFTNWPDDGMDEGGKLQAEPRAGASPGQRLWLQ